MPDNNGANISLSDTFNNFHTYKIDWTPEEITWSIDGQVGRIKKRSDTYNETTKRYEYPQTPARVQLSLWPGGLPSNGKGTIEWAGGLVDWNSEDMQRNQYYYAGVKEVTMECYDPPSDIKRSGSKAYIYTNDAGTQDSLELTDKPTILKSLLGTGTNMSADYPSAKPSSSRAASTTRGGGSSSSSTSSAEPEETSAEVATIPGLTGAGPGLTGQRGADDAPEEDSNSNADSNSNSNANSGGGSANSGGGGSSSNSRSSASSSSAPAPTGGFVQGDSATASTQGNGAAGQGEAKNKVLGGSVFAGLVAVAGMLLL